VNELTPQGQRMVKALRSERMSAEERARLRARVLRTAAAGSMAAAATATTAKASGALSGAAASPAAAVGAASGPLAKAVSAGLLWKVGVVSALVVASVPVTQSMLVPREQASRSTEHAPRAQRAPAPTVQRVREPTATAPVAQRVAPAPVSSPPRVITVEAAPAPPSPHVPLAKPKHVEASSSLNAESALIEQALEAVRDGDRERARRVLSQHASSYPQGLLAPERERVRARLEAESAVSPAPEP
jgi:TolA-binding protein